MSSLRRLLDACINDHTRDIIETVIHTGVRRREVLGLTWNQRESGSIYLTKTTTEEVRGIPINDDLAASFKRVRAKNRLKSQKELQQMLGYQTMAMTIRFTPLSQEHKERTVNLLRRLTASGNGSCHCTVTFAKSSVTATS